MLKGIIFVTSAASCLYAAANVQDPVIRILISAVSLITTLVLGFLWGSESVFIWLRTRHKN